MVEMRRPGSRPGVYINGKCEWPRVRRPLRSPTPSSSANLVHNPSLSAVQQVTKRNFALQTKEEHERDDMVSRDRDGFHASVGWNSQFL